jgi:hypothetical protein
LALEVLAQLLVAVQARMVLILYFLPLHLLVGAVVVHNHKMEHPVDRVAAAAV